MKLAAEIAAQSTAATMISMRRTTASEFAADCYDIAQAFLHDSRFWGKAELAMWLMGPYSRVAHNVSDAPESARPSLREIDVTTIEDIIDAAHDEVVEALTLLDETDFATARLLMNTMLDSGFVAPFVDTNGNEGWTPTTKAHRLADRVLSLLVAAFMTTRSVVQEIPLAIAA
ncbi:hypothetical protein AKJ09_04193 [Labilithrix luteola]|uniref:Uncharacterized protein n=1 Tax=Labilithrix luteola TaxID=1391654 RepID=A0A0K1PWL5_9BACT|nr:hypothetical protein [Labilithrix luteola]AKU97529.1 hypothetical protein AKJ09_04193 [Labilithrix luteola]